MQSDQLPPLDAQQQLSFGLFCEIGDFFEEMLILLIHSGRIKCSRRKKYIVTFLSVCSIVFSWAYVLKRFVFGPPSSISTVLIPSMYKDTCGLLTIQPGYLDTAGLGNKMFAYASLLGLAETSKRVAALPSGVHKHLRRTFYISSMNLPIGEGGVPFDPNESEPVTPCCKYNATKVQELQRHENCGGVKSLRAYLQSWKFFHPRYERRIRKEFQFRDSIKLAAFGRMEAVLRRHKNADTLVGVHIRQGDFSTAEKLVYGHMPADSAYIKKAMAHFERKFGFQKLLFVLLGNSWDWNLKNFLEKHQNVFVLEPTAPEVDMCLLSMCNHTIMTTGTFGWWSAYLANGHTTYQKEFARPYSPHSSEYAEADYFLPKWKAL